MRPRKTKEISRTLLQKGFVRNPAKGDHHEYYVLLAGGQKTHVTTFLSHGSKEYGTELMSKMKRQLGFQTAGQAEDFFDCPMSGRDYLNLLRQTGELD